MIPEYVDVEKIESSLQETPVYQQHMDVDLQGKLLDVVANAKEMGMGNVGIVVLTDKLSEDTASQAPDIARYLLDHSNGKYDTIILRAFNTGVIVSNDYSRAELEEAQYYFLDDFDYVAATQTAVNQLSQPMMPVVEVSAISAAILGATVLFTVLFSKKKFWKTSTTSLVDEKNKKN